MMDAKTCREAVRRIISEVLELKPSAVPDNAAVGVITKWDSLHHIVIMAELEAQLKVQFNTDEIPTLTSLDAICRRLSD
jgi:acyl carrier protein